MGTGSVVLVDLILSVAWRGVGESDLITQNIKKMQVLQGFLRFEGQNYVTRFHSGVDDKILS